LFILRIGSQAATSPDRDIVKYRREIDGLRAVAVLAVIFFHAGFHTFSGGFVGVDVFFVISGYLITTLIVSEMSHGRFSIVDFYERRSRRLLPSLFLVMAVSIPLAWVTLLPVDLISFSKSLVAVALFASNFFFWRDGGYFETAAELKPLLHTWSLAVEEQYYLLFPPFLMIMWRLGKGRILWLMLFLTLSSLSFAQISSSHQPVADFFLLPTRAWELAIGVIVALYMSDKDDAAVSPVSRRFFSTAGLVLVVSSVFIFQKDTPFPSVYGLIPTIGTAFIILFSGPDTFVGRLLGSKPFVGIGLVSYSAYLWHQPLFAFALYHFSRPSTFMMLCLAASSLVLAVFSWKYIEKPFRDRRKLTRQTIFRFSVSLSMTFVIFGALSALLFGSFSVDSVESRTAKALLSSKAVFTSNMDERQFIKYRIKYENLNPEVIVLGSSRIMLIGEQEYRGKVLNLGVSGASVEDDIAIADLVMKKFKPSTVLLGADPWLFNAKSGQDRWLSLRDEYVEGLSSLGRPDLKALANPPKWDQTLSSGNELFNLGSRLYDSVNRSKLAVDNDVPEVRDKIRRDGTRVYNTSYATKTEGEMEREFDDLLNYSMASYIPSKESKSNFESLVESYSKRCRVVLVLSPYHPKMFERMKAERRIYLDTEREFRALARKYGVRIVGSYDPAMVGCGRSDFYDGMHPKENCMEKALSELARAM
jgi:peptidoglycan/LPS O-acetylase OafA/YrhL